MPVDESMLPSKWDLGAKGGPGRSCTGLNPTAVACFGLGCIDDHLWPVWGCFAITGLATDSGEHGDSESEAK